MNVAVYRYFQIEGVEALQDITHPTSLIPVVHPIEDHLFNVQWFGIAHHANHTVGYGHTKILVGVNVIGCDLPITLIHLSTVYAVYLICSGGLGNSCFCFAIEKA